MRRSLLAALGALLLIPAAAGAQTPPGEPTIPPGAKAGGVDVGNLTLTQAAAKLDATFAAGFARPVKVRVAGRRFTVRPAAVGFAFDAMRTARRANIAAGQAPKAPDGSVAVDVPLATTIEAAKLAAQVTAVRTATRVPARDATVRITLRHLQVHKARAGVTLRDKR